MKKQNKKDDLDKFLDLKTTRKALLYGLIIALVIVCVDAIRLSIKYCFQLYYGENYNKTTEFLANGTGIAVALVILLLLISVTLKKIKKHRANL